MEGEIPTFDFEWDPETEEEEASLLGGLLQALRGGQYRQCREAYEDHGSYCVLGLAAHLAGWKPRGTDLGGPGERKEQADRLRRMLGLNWTEWSRLPALNDVGFSFGEIAGMIEDFR